MTISVHAAAQYLILLDQQHEGDGISNLKLQKLVYYSQGYHAALFDKPLFDESIEAWRHGPVCPVLYRKNSSQGSNAIPVDPQISIDRIPPDSAELMDEVFEVYGKFSAWSLRDMTHEEKPWLDHEAKGDEIPVEEMRIFFKGLLN